MTKTKYSTRHGGPFDRGAADAYYRRGYDPHYYTGATYSTPRVDGYKMTTEELDAYKAGWEYQMESGEFKS